MKILIIGQMPPPYYGQSLQIQKIKKIADKNNFNYRFIRLNFSDSLNEVSSFKISKLFRLITIFFTISKTLVIFKPDYVYYPPAGPNRIPMYRDFCLLFPIRLINSKLIFHFHAGGISKLYKELNRIEKALYRFTYFNNFISICCSKNGETDPDFLMSKKIVILPHGEEDNYLPLERSNREFTVLFVGSCRESKGIYEFIKIIASVKKNVPYVCAKIVGEYFSEKEKEIIQKAVEEGIVTYEGIKIGGEKNYIFNHSHLFLFPTFYESENFPTVILEAFSFGLPVISTKWRGVVDQVVDDYNGYLFDIHDTCGMGNAIFRIATDLNLYARLSKNARKEFEEKYTIKLFENNLLDIIKSLQ